MTVRSTLPVQVGRSLTLLRERRHLSQSELARAIGWMPVRVSRLERGEGATLANLEAVARALGVPVKTLFP